MKNLIFILCSLTIVSSFSQEIMNESIEDTPFQVVENVPVYLGCEDLSSNSSKRACMSDKIQNLVSSKLNLNVANSLDLPNGTVTMYVHFKINKKGKVINIKARGPHPKLEEEAIRVIALIPDMKPATQRGKPVIVPYSLPIKFNTLMD